MLRRLMIGILALGIGDETRLRGLKASGLASLCLKSFSSDDKVWGSLFARKLDIVVSKDVLVGRKRSGALMEPEDFELKLLRIVLNDGRGEAVVRGRSLGRVAAEEGFLFSSSAPS